MLKKLLFILFAASCLWGDIIYEKWDQLVEIDTKGQTVVIDAILKAELQENYYHNSWHFIFDSRSKVKILYVKVDGSPSNYNFTNNTLMINIGKLFDDQRVKISIKYILLQENNNPFLLQEYVSLPDWLYNSEAYLKIITPKYYRCCSRHPRLNQNKYIFSWQGKVPRSGITELFILTPENKQWQFSQKIEIKGSRLNEGLTFYYPILFQTGATKTIKYSTAFTPQPQEINVSGNYHQLNFKDSNYMEIGITAELETGKNQNNYTLLQPDKFTYLTAQDKTISQSLAKKIILDNVTSFLPKHVILAKWTHQYIKYDLGYKDKKFSLSELLEKKRGVCGHYSQLYIALCRAANIPAVEIQGYAYSITNIYEKPQWQPHSWVLVYADGKWQPVDPTWDLTNGTLPVSHIAFYYPHQTPYSYKAEKYYGQLFVNDNKITINEIQNQLSK